MLIMKRTMHMPLYRDGTWPKCPWSKQLEGHLMFWRQYELLTVVLNLCDSPVPSMLRSDRSATVQTSCTQGEECFLVAAKSPGICSRGTWQGEWIWETLALDTLFSITLQHVRWVIRLPSWHKKLSDWSVRLFDSDILYWTKPWPYEESRIKRCCCSVVRAIVGPNILPLRKAQLQWATIKEHLMEKLLGLVHVPNSQWT